MDMTETQKDRLRLYAWNYFSYHAEQRIKTLYFYLVIIGALIAGLLSAAARVPQGYFAWLSVFGFLMALFSLAFALLDKRNADLVRNGEAALKWLDQQEELLPQEQTPPHVMSIFSRDDFDNATKLRIPLVNRRVVSFSTVFSGMFWLIGLGGIAGAIVCLLKDGV